MLVKLKEFLGHVICHICLKYYVQLSAWQGYSFLKTDWLHISEATFFMIIHNQVMLLCFNMLCLYVIHNILKMSLSTHHVMEFDCRGKKANLQGTISYEDKTHTYAINSFLHIS